MKLFGQKKWPPPLERRKSENAETRAQIERAVRDRIRLSADMVETRTAETQGRIDRIADILFRED